MQINHESTNLHLLLVEDVSLHCDVYKQMIQMDSPEHRVDICMDGSSAVEMLKQKAQDYDCLLLDLHLPDMNGFEIAKVAMEQSEKLPIIFITGDDDDEKAVNALSSGAQDYLLKGEYGQMMLMRSIRYAMERKRFELENKQLKEHLQEEKALSKKQREFSSLVGHEFRTPLAIMSSSIQMLDRKMSNGDVDQLSKYIKKLHAAIKRLTHLMDSALAYSKMEEGKMRYAPMRVDVKAIIESIVEDFSALHADMDIRTDLGALPEHVFADEALCEHVFANLISNAIKYSQGYADHIELSAQCDGTDISITVRDFGRGIESSELAHIGDRFYRGTNTDDTSGTGIGIYISRNILQMHGGSLAYESEVGKGTTVTVTLPISDARQGL